MDKIKNRRNYLRLPYEKNFKFFSPSGDAIMANSINLNQGGVLLVSKHLAPLSSVISMQTDLNILSRYINIKDLLVLQGDKLVSKVVRLIFDHQKDIYYLGLNFIKSIEIYRKDVQAIF